MTMFPNDKQIKELTNFSKPNCLSIYLPNVQSSSYGTANRIELKNLLSQAAEAMRALGLESSYINKTLDPTRTLLESVELYPPKNEDLALFMHPDMFRFYHIPGGYVEYSIRIQSGFYLEPLINIINNNKQYYVLSLNHNNVGLYVGDFFILKSVAIKKFPKNLKKSLALDEYPKSSQAHTVSNFKHKKRSDGSEVQHGHYNARETDKVMLLNFFRLVDKRLKPVLELGNYPLILAGSTRLIPIYKKVNKYENLVDVPILGNYEYATADEIREKAKQIIEDKIYPSIRGTK